MRLKGVYHRGNICAFVMIMKRIVMMDESIHLIGMCLGWW